MQRIVVRKGRNPTLHKVYSAHRIISNCNRCGVTDDTLIADTVGRGGEGRRGGEWCQRLESNTGRLRSHCVYAKIYDYRAS